MSFAREAWRGLKAEVKAAPSLRHKLSILVPGSLTMVKELAVGGLTVLPFGISSALLYRSLPSLTDFMSQQQQTAPADARPARTRYGVLLQAGQAYGPGPRHKLDIYVPQQVGERLSLGEKPQAPVVFFTHGGVWASGETWHYSRMATRLAQAGCLVFVHTYTLYPDALVPQMVDEVSAALTWALEHAPHYGGDPTALTAIGHSAGTHLLSLALMKRAGLPVGPEDWHAPAGAHRHQAPANHDITVQPVASPVAGSPAWHPPLPFADLSSAQGDERMPAAFLGMAGVFDIDKHYEHERARGVHHLSMMSRAMGGFGHHASLSPSRVLNHFADCLQQASHSQAANTSSSSQQPWSSPAAGAGQPSSSAADTQQAQHRQQVFAALSSGQLQAGASSAQQPAPSFYQSFHLRGDAIPHRSRLTASHTSASLQPGDIRIGSHPLHSDSQESERSWVVHASSGTSSSSSSAAHLAAGLARLPRTFLLAGCFDHVVPWHESVEMMHALRRCDVPSRVLMYQWANHGSFVVDWRPLEAAADDDAAEQGICNDAGPASLADQPSSGQQPQAGEVPRSSDGQQQARDGDGLSGLADWTRDVVLLVTTLGQPQPQQPQQHAQGSLVLHRAAAAADMTSGSGNIATDMALMSRL